MQAGVDSISEPCEMRMWLSDRSAKEQFVQWLESNSRPDGLLEKNNPHTHGDEKTRVASHYTIAVLVVYSMSLWFSGVLVL